MTRHLKVEIAVTVCVVTIEVVVGLLLWKCFNWLAPDLGWFNRTMLAVWCLMRAGYYSRKGNAQL